MLYFMITPRWRTFLLFAASYYFYMCWKPEYIFLILGSTMIDFIAAKKIYHSDTDKRRKMWLFVSLASNLSVLFLFKYFNFLSENVTNILNSFNVFYEQPVYDLLLPVGISFYTFQTLSYSVDVYRGKLKPENSFMRFALFVSFFPQLVAGPIERATHLLPQFKKSYSFEYHRVVSGLRLILWGFFKKVVIADNLALLVDQVFNNPGGQNGLTFAIATYFFAFQIYCDFSGYSDIAIGSARILGFDLMQNFRQPYLSKSIKEFWGRWHISLSTWFRDYVYIPIGGNRAVKWRWYYNLLITFLISGLWHGANWTFVIWGAFHGVLLILGIELVKYIKPPSTNLGKALRIIIVFHLVTLAWVFFRAESIQSAFDVIQSFKNVPNLTLGILEGVPTLNGLGRFTISTLVYFSSMIALLLMIDVLSTRQSAILLYRKNRFVRFASYFILFYWILLGGYFGQTAFIYFQF